jgi:hypothetical protein
VRAVLNFFWRLVAVVKSWGQGAIPSTGQADREARTALPVTNKRLTKDDLLRKPSPEEIVGETFKALKNQRLPGRVPEQPILIKDASRVDDALKRLGLRNDLEPADIPFTRGLHHQGKFALFPSVVEELRHPELMRRAAAVRTVCHEFFHALRESPRSQTPRNVEEGLADLFADIMCERLLGDALSDYGSYPELREGVGLLCGLLGRGDFNAGWTAFLETRRTQNMYGWVHSELENCGLSPHDIAQILDYTSVRVWLTTIQRLTQDFQKG